MRDFTMENWEQFEKKYPSAYYFILGCQNENEYIRLKNELKEVRINPEHRQWIENRLKDMESIIPELKTS